MNNSTSQISPAWPTRWPKGSFSVWWTLGFILLTALVLLIVTILTMLFLIASDPKVVNEFRSCATMAKAFVPAAIVQLPMEAAALLCVVIGLPLLTKFSLRELGFRVPNWRDIGYALLGMFGMFIVTDLGGSLGQGLTHTKQPEQVVQMFLAIHDARTVVFFVIFAIVLAPIFEETIFRLFLFNLGLRYGGFWGGAIFSGLLFGFAHWDTCGSAKGLLFGTVLPLALGGMVLSWVYYRSRNAYTSMISHGLFNAVSTAALHFAPKLAGGS